MKKTLTTQGRRLNSRKNTGCFELFGFDFMIDAEKKVWLIEGNTNPCLDESNDYMSRLVPRMINDVLELTMDKVFNLKKSGKIVTSGNQKAKKTVILDKKDTKVRSVVIKSGSNSPSKPGSGKNSEKSKVEKSVEEVSKGARTAKKDYKYPLEGFSDRKNIWKLLGTMK